MVKGKLPVGEMVSVHIDKAMIYDLGGAAQ
jgi:hypothetical protein